MAEPISIIAIVITVGGLLTNIVVQSSRDSRKNYDKRIDAKLDKEEYQREQDTLCKRLGKCEDVNKTLLNIERAISSQGTDIEWIKKGLEGLTSQSTPRTRKPRLN
jgi:hypothetical protein